MALSEVGPWARDKLERLRKYLNAYTTIMRKQRWCQGYVYVDAFAGPGEHRVRQTQKPTRSVGFQTMLLDIARHAQDDDEQREFIAGSPRIALEIEHPFTWYVFVEKDPERVRHLQRLREEFGETRNIVIRQRDCNGYLLERLVENSKIDWSKWRAVVFLDPFGMQVPWSTIEALGRTGAIEVFLNLPVGMAIQRLLLRSGRFTPRQRSKLDSYFGSPEWYEVLYRKETNLFGQEDQVKIEESGRALLDWYRRRLREVFGYASKASLIRNTRGGHLYYLLLATPNKTGARIASDILGAGERV